MRTVRQWRADNPLTTVTQELAAAQQRASILRDLLWDNPHCPITRAQLDGVERHINSLKSQPGDLVVPLF